MEKLVYKNGANEEYEPIDPIIENINKEIMKLKEEIEGLNDAPIESENNEPEKQSSKDKLRSLKQELNQRET